MENALMRPITSTDDLLSTVLCIQTVSDVNARDGNRFGETRNKKTVLSMHR